MRPAVDEDLGIGPEAHERPQDRAHRGAILRAGVELAVGEGAGAALAEAVVRARIELPVVHEPRDVVAPPRHLTAKLDDRDARPRLDEAQRREAAAGPLPTTTTRARLGDAGAGAGSEAGGAGPGPQATR